MERRQHKHTRETSGVPPSSSTGSLSTEARQIHKAKNTEARHVPRWARRHCSPPASLIEEEGSHEDEHVPESPSPPLTHRPSYSTNRAPSAPPAPSSRMLRGVDPPPPSPPPPPPAAPSPPLSQHTCQTISDAFNNIVRGNKGYGGGVLRIESLTRGLLYEGAWGKVRAARLVWFGLEERWGAEDMAASSRLLVCRDWRCMTLSNVFLMYLVSL